jgi:hypothetical protein
LNCLAEANDVSEVAEFVASMSETARELNETALALHSEVVGPISRVRNEATFHYPGEQTRRALKSALSDLAKEVGSIEGESRKVRDTRFNYADDVVADEEKMGEIVAKIAVAEKALMQFINHVQDEFFMRAAEVA